MLSLKCLIIIIILKFQSNFLYIQRNLREIEYVIYVAPR